MDLGIAGADGAVRAAGEVAVEAGAAIVTVVVGLDGLRGGAAAGAQDAGDVLENGEKLGEGIEWTGEDDIEFGECGGVVGGGFEVALQPHDGGAAEGGDGERDSDAVDVELPRRGGGLAERDDDVGGVLILAGVVTHPEEGEVDLRDGDVDEFERIFADGLLELEVLRCGEAGRFELIGDLVEFGAEVLEALADAGEAANGSEQRASVADVDGVAEGELVGTDREDWTREQVALRAGGLEEAVEGFGRRGGAGGETEDVGGVGKVDLVARVGGAAVVGLNDRRGYIGGEWDGRGLALLAGGDAP